MSKESTFDFNKYKQEIIEAAPHISLGVVIGSSVYQSYSILLGFDFEHSEWGIYYVNSYSLRPLELIKQVRGHQWFPQDDEVYVFKTEDGIQACSPLALSSLDILKDNDYHTNNCIICPYIDHNYPATIDYPISRIYYDGAEIQLKSKYRNVVDWNKLLLENFIDNHRRKELQKKVDASLSKNIHGTIEHIRNCIPIFSIETIKQALSAKGVVESHPEYERDDGRSYICGYNHNFAVHFEWDYTKLGITQEKDGYLENLAKGEAQRRIVHIEESSDCDGMLSDASIVENFIADVAKGYSREEHLSWVIESTISSQQEKTNRTIADLNKNGFKNKYFWCLEAIRKCKYVEDLNDDLSILDYKLHNNQDCDMSAFTNKLLWTRIMINRTYDRLIDKYNPVEK